MCRQSNVLGFQICGICLKLKSLLKQHKRLFHKVNVAGKRHVREKQLGTSVIPVKLCAVDVKPESESESGPVEISSIPETNNTAAPIHCFNFSNQKNTISLESAITATATIKVERDDLHLHKESNETVSVSADDTCNTDSVAGIMPIAKNDTENVTPANDQCAKRCNVFQNVASKSSRVCRTEKKKQQRVDWQQYYVTVLVGNTRTFQCNNCAKSFCYKACLQRHITRAHLDVSHNAMQCSRCGHSYKTMNRLKRHRCRDKNQKTNVRSKVLPEPNLIADVTSMSTRAIRLLQRNRNTRSADSSVKPSAEKSSGKRLFQRNVKTKEKLTKSRIEEKHTKSPNKKQPTKLPNEKKPTKSSNKKKPTKSPSESSGRGKAGRSKDEKIANMAVVSRPRRHQDSVFEVASAEQLAILDEEFDDAEYNNRMAKREWNDQDFQPAPGVRDASDATDSEDDVKPRKKRRCHFQTVKKQRSGYDYKSHYTRQACANNKFKSQFSCKHCFFSTTMFYQMKRHLMVEHLNIEFFTCKFCLRPFEQSETHTCRRKRLALERADGRQVSDDELLQLLHPSERLPALADVASDLSIKIKRFVCDICGRRFSSGRNIREHKNRHAGIKPYLCSVCGRDFYRRGDMQSHVKHAHEQHKFACKFCPKRFAVRHKLLLHEGTHTGNRPHKCEYCGKGFTDPSNLICHIRIHTGEKPYVCSTCGYRCAQASALKKHYKYHHSNQTDSSTLSSQTNFTTLSQVPPTDQPQGKLVHASLQTPVTVPTAASGCLY